MFQIVKDNFVYIILVIVAFVAGIYFIPPRATETYNKIVETNSLSRERLGRSLPSHFLL